MRAWHRLHDERPHTLAGYAAPMGAMILKSRPGRIPWTVVDRWSDRHGLAADEASFLDRCIAILDSEYLAWWAEQEGK
jgi:hypothetical protein